jgi:hypothetical protein
MELSRYAVMDAYTLEELRREYQATDALGRIQLLAKFPKADDEDDSTAVSLPPELVRMAAEDDIATVRQWIARHGRFWNYSLLAAAENRLVNDPDPFVRACLMENQTHVTEGNASRAFLFATHLERLALMRNLGMARANALIWKVFDLEDKDEGPEDRLGRLGELGIDLEQRKELALAFVSNSAAQKDSRRDTQDFIDGGEWVDCRQRWATVWKLAAKWPSESGVPRAVFRSFATEDKVKAEIYQQSTERRLRSDILKSCNEFQQETIKLGITDTWGTCRYISYSKISWINLGPDALEAVLSGDDEDALGGLAHNEFLPVEMLQRIASKIEEIEKATGNYGRYSSDVERTIERARKRRSYLIEQAQALFSNPVAQTDQLRDEKVATLGERQGSLTDQLRDELGQIQDQLKDLESTIENVRPNQLPDELAQLQNQLKGLESTIESFRSGQSPIGQAPSHVQRDSRSKWIITIVLATGVALLAGFPLGTTIGCGLIAVAIAMRFAK